MYKPCCENGVHLALLPAGDTVPAGSLQTTFIKALPRLLSLFFPSSPPSLSLFSHSTLSTATEKHEPANLRYSHSVSAILVPTLPGGGYNQHDELCLPSFRCKVGGEWKDRSQFSVTQQRNLQTARVDPAHSGMTCKQHSAGSRSELRCELCGLVKSIDDFSKSSRRKGEYASYHGAVYSHLSSALTISLAMPTLRCVDRNSRTRPDAGAT